MVVCGGLGWSGEGCVLVWGGVVWCDLWQSVVLLSDVSLSTPSSLPETSARQRG